MSTTQVKLINTKLTILMVMIASPCKLQIKWQNSIDIEQTESLFSTIDTVNEYNIWVNILRINF